MGYGCKPPLIALPPPVFAVPVGAVDGPVTVENGFVRDGQALDKAAEPE